MQNHVHRYNTNIIQSKNSCMHLFALSTKYYGAANWETEITMNISGKRKNKDAG
jgi:hypothetical protein